MKYFMQITLLSLVVLIQMKVIAQTTQVFNQSGTYTVPAGVTTLRVSAWGAGGLVPNNRNGAGGGAFAQSKPITVTPGQVINVTVGTPGTNGTSRFGDFLTASGANGQTGGSVSSGDWVDFSFRGGNGGDGSPIFGFGGGGGAGGTNRAGNNGANASFGDGIGGSAGNGGGNGGNGRNSGQAPGGGMGGSISSGLVSGNGRVIVSYDCSSAIQLSVTNQNGANIPNNQTQPSLTNETDFGKNGIQPFGKPVILKLTNQGSVGMVISNITLTGTHVPDFSMRSFSFPLILDPGKDTNLIIAFSPATIGRKSAEVQITLNNCQQPLYRFAIAGTGVIWNHTNLNQNGNFNSLPGIDSVVVHAWGGVGYNNERNLDGGGGGSFVLSKPIAVRFNEPIPVVIGVNGSPHTHFGSFFTAYGSINRAGGIANTGPHIAVSFKGGDGGIGTTGTIGFFPGYGGGGGGAAGWNGPGSNGGNAKPEPGGAAGLGGTGGGGGGRGGDGGCCDVLDAGRTGQQPGGGHGGFLASFGQGLGGVRVFYECPPGKGQIQAKTPLIPARRPELVPDSIISLEGKAPTAANGLVYRWESSINGTSWTLAKNNTNSLHYRVDLDSLMQTTHYRRINTNGCNRSDTSNTVTITVVPVTQRGTLNGKVTNFLNANVGTEEVLITATRLNAVPGSPKGYTYSTLTGTDGRFTIGEVYFGNPDEDSAQFSIKAFKLGFKIGPDSIVRTIRPSLRIPLDANFTDTTEFAVSGTTLQRCTGCQVGNSTPVWVDCPVNGVNIRGTASGNIFQSTQSNTVGGERGRFDMVFSQSGNRTFRATLSGRNLFPLDTVINVNRQISNLRFTDSLTRTISGRISAGCGYNIGKIGLTFRDTGAVKCFTRSIDTDENGFFNLRMPARPFEIVVNSVTLGNSNNIDDADAVKLFFNTLLPRDSMRIDLTERDTILNLIYRRPPSVVVHGLTPNPGCVFTVIPQLEKRAISVDVFQGPPNLGCRALDDTLRIFTNIQVDDINEAIVRKTINGRVRDTLTGGSPNMIAPYKKVFNVQFIDAYNRQAQASAEVVVTGTKTSVGFFTTVSPDLPLLILHDPPGGQSFSSWQQSVSNETTMRVYAANSRTTEGWMQVKVGTSANIGLGYSTPVSVWGSVNGNVGVSQRVNTSTESTITTTTTQFFSTSADADFTGDDADVVVGGALNILYAPTDELIFNPSNCSFDTTRRLILSPNGFKTEYAYTIGEIKNSVIPDQLAKAEDQSLTPEQRANFATSAKVWQQVVANNEANKRRAAFNINRSFSAGASQTHTTTSRTARTSTIEFDMEINNQLALELGFDIGGSGVSGGAKVGFKVETGRSASNMETRETTTSYTLAENNPGDNFSVDVKRDPVYNTPVFELVSGRSSCPFEEGTQPRDGIQVVVPNPFISGVEPNEPAVFNVQIANTSQSNETRTYRLFAPDAAANPNQAVITVTGQPIPQAGLAYTLAAGASINVMIAISRNTLSTFYSYEGLPFTVTDNCDGGVSKTFTLSAFFKSPCSAITLSQPGNNWVVNGSGNNLPLNLTGYNRDQLNDIEVQFAQLFGGTWVTGQSILKNQLGPTSTTIQWNTANIPDGQYRLRLKLNCATGSVLTESFTGVIDRKPPAFLGKPDPTDDVLSPGDMIGVRYNEKINVIDLENSNIRLIRRLNNQPIPVDVTGFDNQIILVPRESLLSYAGESFKVELQGVKDLFSNQRSTPDSFKFLVAGHVPSVLPDALTLRLRNGNLPENIATQAIAAGLKKQINLAQGDTTMTVVFELKTPAMVNTRINYFIGGTAIFNKDYRIAFDSVENSSANSFDGAIGSLVLPSNRSRCFLRIIALNNTDFAGDRTISVGLLDGGNYSLGEAIIVNGIIIEDDYPNKFEFTGNGLFSNSALWLSGNKPSITVPAGTEVIINHQVGGECVLDVPVTFQKGSRLTIKDGKVLKLQNSLEIKR